MKQFDLIFLGQQAGRYGQVTGDQHITALGAQGLRPACSSALSGDDDDVGTAAAGPAARSTIVSPEVSIQ